MSISAMKCALQSLESVEKVKGWNKDSVIGRHCSQSAHFLRQAIAEAEKQEAWKTSDAAYRPDDLPQDFIVHEVENESDWSEWVCPDPEQYFMQCCDCGLVHEMQFKVVKYSVGDECDGIDDPDVRGIFRARRRSNA